MRCISCEVEINPKWTHAIDINVCPFCGSNIMEEHLKNLLSSLADVMNKLQAYPDQLNDWMLSNFNYIKTDSSKLIEFLPKEQIKEQMKDLKKIEQDKDFQERKDRAFTVKVKTDSGEQEVKAEKIQDEEKTNEFFKRAEAVKPNIDGFRSTAEKTEHLKRLALQIKQAGSTAITSDSGENSYITPEMIEEADPDAVAEMESLFSSNEVSSSLGESSSGEEEIPSVVLNMANRAKGKHGSNPADLFKLQQLQNRLQESRRNFESGTNRGKGSFSRA
jgi:hypothetical protein